MSAGRGSLFALVAVSLILAGCDDSLRWKEDVQLPDGRVVVVERYQEFKGPHEIGQRPTESGSWFEFTNPDTGQKVRWDGDRTQMAVVLLMKDRVPYLLIRLTFGGWTKFNCPDPGFLLYRRDPEGWRHLPLQDLPIKRVRVNMTYSARRAPLKEYRYALPASVTSDSKHDQRPWWISFEGLTQQTFGFENCKSGRGDISDPFGVGIPKKETER